MASKCLQVIVVAVVVAMLGVSETQCVLMVTNDTPDLYSNDNFLYTNALLGGGLMNGGGVLNNPLLAGGGFTIRGTPGVLNVDSNGQILPVAASYPLTSAYSLTLPLGVPRFMTSGLFQAGSSPLLLNV